MHNFPYPQRFKTKDRNNSFSQLSATTTNNSFYSGTASDTASFTQQYAPIMEYYIKDVCDGLRNSAAGNRKRDVEASAREDTRIQHDPEAALEEYIDTIKLLQRIIDRDVDVGCPLMFAVSSNDIPPIRPLMENSWTYYMHTMKSATVSENTHKNSTTVSINI